jgi:hypothetical protein
MGRAAADGAGGFAPLRIPAGLPRQYTASVLISSGPIFTTSPAASGTRVECVGSYVSGTDVPFAARRRAQHAGGDTTSVTIAACSSDNSNDDNEDEDEDDEISVHGCNIRTEQQLGVVLGLGAGVGVYPDAVHRAAHGGVPLDDVVAAAAEEALHALVPDHVLLWATVHQRQRW